MSFLNTVVNGLLEDAAQETFIDKIHQDTGITKDKLSEIFQHGMSLMTSIDADPIILGKSSVYKFLDELGDDGIEEQKASKHCTCPYDDDDDTKDVGTDTKCPIHGKNVKENKESKKRKLPDASLDCNTCKGEGCKKCDWTGRKNLENVNEDDGEERVYRIFDVKDKVWVGKPSTHVKRLRNRVDKLDLEYGAVRYQARLYTT